MDAQCSACDRADAKYVCSCVFPAVLVCAACLENHIDTTALHSLALLKKAAPKVPAQVQGNEVCDVCRAKPPVRFCLCTEPLRKYCEDCDFSHYRKAPLLNHSEHPMCAFPGVASGQVPLEVFKKKQQFINDFQHRLGLELVNFDAFVNEVGTQFDQLIAVAIRQKEALLRDLRVQRATLVGHINTAQQVIEAKRYKDALEVTTVLDDILFYGYLSAVPLETQMFSGTVDVQKVMELLKTAAAYSVSSRLNDEYEVQPQLIPVNVGNTFWLYDPATLEELEFTFDYNSHVDGSTAYCYVAEDTFLCCGGGMCTSVHSQVFSFNVQTCTVVRAASMNSPRCFLGIWRYKSECVYAFGGYANGELNTAEKYGLTKKTWTDLRRTLQVAKELCSVCEFANSLYISGIHVSGSSIEHFNPQTEAFTLLRHDNIRCASIMCSDGIGVYCIRQNTIERANVVRRPETATFYVKDRIPQIGTGHYWLCCPMKWYGGELTSVLSQGAFPKGLFRFNPAQSEFTQVVTLPFADTDSLSALFRLYLLFPVRYS